MTVLVTGAAGFIGSHFVRSALTDRYPALAGEPVVVLDALTYAGNLANLDPVAGSPRLRFVHGDICDVAAVDSAMAGARAVVHFAAESHVDRSITGATGFVVTNVVGTQVMLDAALRHGVRTFVHVSTDEVYGSIEHGSWPEDHALHPRSPYAASKAAADLLAQSYTTTYGLDVRVTRCSNNYGPYQFPEKVIPLFVTTLLDGGDVPLYGDGGNVRDWLHVEDHCRAVEAVLDRGRPGGVYNVGGGTELTNRELTERLLTAVGAGPERVRPVADRPGHDRRYSVDSTLIRTELGWTPQVPFEQGLADTVAWYTQHRSWWEPLRDKASDAREGHEAVGVR